MGYQSMAHRTKDATVMEVGMQTDIKRVDLPSLFKGDSL